MTAPLWAPPGGWEILLIVLVILLLFGAKKLPELARGTGQALRIFKSETKGLRDDDKDEQESAAGTTPVGERPRLDAARVEEQDAIARERRDTTNG